MKLITLNKDIEIDGVQYIKGQMIKVNDSFDNSLIKTELTKSDGELNEIHNGEE